MKKFMLPASTFFKPAFLPLVCLLVLATSCQKFIDPVFDKMNNGKPPHLLKDFQQVNLVGNNDEYAPKRVDPLLVNAWGLVFSGNGTAWISAQGAGVSTIYDKDGQQVLAAVSIPSPNEPTGGHPTGVVFNASTDFTLPNGNPARFIFDGDDGVLSGWNNGNLTMAIRMVDSSATSAYTGLAIGTDAGANFLYAANLKTGKIDVFDKDWQSVSKSFTDPDLPAGYAPFNIQNLAGKLYVMYAKVGEDGEEEAHPGAGYVDVYNTDGSLDRRLISKGQLNAPWGIAIAPASFYSNDGITEPTILVGNFGDGKINAYKWDGTWIGQLRAHGEPIEIEGLWAISFAPATATTINPNWLYFTAGPDDEEEGLFGYITK